MRKDCLLENPEFMELVRICNTIKCTHIVALKILQRAGFKIKSTKTYQRAKKEIEQNRKKRIEQIVNEFPDHAADTVDTAIAVDFELWAIYRDTRNTSVKLKALSLIMANCKEKTAYLENSPILAKFIEKLACNKTETAKTTEVINGVGQDQETSS